MKNHFQGVVAEENWKNDLLNEQRQMRALLERIAQALEQPKGANEHDHSILGQERKKVRRGRNKSATTG